MALEKLSRKYPEFEIAIRSEKGGRRLIINRGNGNGTRISQLTEPAGKRGAILEQRRRPTLKFQHRFGFRQVIAMQLNSPSQHR